jgi:hypothetical protein
MKYLKETFLGLCLFSSGFMFSQNLNPSSLPTSLVEASKAAGIPAKGVSWELKNGVYEAEYKLNGVEITNLFSETSVLLATETELKVNDLPPAVLKYSSVTWPGKKITEASKIEWVSGTVQYEIEIEGNEYLLDNNGMLISQDEEDDDDSEQEVTD